MEIALSALGLGKKYRLGQRVRHGSIRDSLTRAARASLQRLRTPSASRTADAPDGFWALRDVSFEIPRGAVVGLIGRNGSGKSTLLKILSRITEPTAGSATVRGRVGSLLEVGTGFHHELTGRENVYVNGAILGMRRAEIARKFDEIVSFADLAPFIDTPVKHYSSGMQMRLAFSVAAHLEPEILLVDEVLAVGDLAFQRKCLGKMDDVSQQGRTVIFVSHQMNQIRRLCGTSMWLDNGRLVECDATNAVVTRYEASFMSRSMTERDVVDGRSAAFLGWTLGRSDTLQHAVDSFETCVVRFFLRIRTRVVDGHHGVALFDADGRVVWGTGNDNLVLDPGLHEIIYRLALPLRPGPYRWQVSLFDQGQLLEGADLVPELAIVTPPLGHKKDQYAGLLNVPHTVSIHRMDDDGHACSAEVYSRTAGSPEDTRTPIISSL
jgi:ABC-type polysaccharide/polyol phosphate transport system ATPase subunit